MKKRLSLSFKLVSLSIFLIIPGIVYSQGDLYTTLFESESIEQWNISGYVIPEKIDGDVTFLFSFHDVDNPVKAIPDTATLQIIDPIDLGECDSVFVRFNKHDILENDESWVVGNVQTYARHEHSPNWYRVFEDLSESAGWVHQLELKFRVAVRTDAVYPGSFRLFDIKIEGKCGT